MEEYVFSNEYFQNIDVLIYTCGYEQCVPKHAYGPTIRSSYMIHYVLDGKGIFKVDNKIYHLTKGDAFCIQPGQLIYYEADKTNPWTYTWIGFQGIKAKQYLNRTTLLENPIFHYDADDHLKLIYEKVYAYNKQTKNKDLLLNSVLYEFLFFLANHFPKTSTTEEKRLEYVEETLKYIELHYTESMTIQHIASHLNIDRSYLHRLFKNKTGKSVTEYIVHFRIQKACQLLINTQYPISVIAQSVGYEDPLYFSRIFKEKMQQTPSLYRKEKAD